MIKGDDVHDELVLNMNQGQVIQHERIDGDTDGDLQYIFGHIGDAAAELLIMSIFRTVSKPLRQPYHFQIRQEREKGRHGKRGIFP